MTDPKRVQSLILNLLFSSSFLPTPTKLVTFYILTLIVYCVRIWSVYHFVLCCLLLICQFSPTNYICPHADWAKSSYCCYFLDELPGLVDFTVFLNLSPRQKREVVELKKLGRKFKISSDGSALYVHPQLKHLSKNTSVKDRVDQVRIDEMLEKLDERGVKAKFYLNLLRLSETSGEKLLVFSQYLLPMMFLERLTVKVKGWSLGKEIFVIISDSENEVREVHMEQFNNSPDAKVFFGSNKACGEGISLVGASRIIILDVHLNPSVTRQAIGPAFRPGQVKKVFTYRLVASGSPEEEDHSTCFRKESIAKLWFEWNKCCGPQDFQMETVDVKDW